MGAQKSGGGIGAVETAFAIIDELETSGEMGVSEIANELEIPTSTAHVHLKTLESQGYALNENGTYRLSLQFLKHGGSVRNRLKLYRAAKKHVDKLANETGEVGNLGVEQHGQRILVYKSEVPDAIYDNTPTGEHTNLHWTALGKSILANLPENRIHQIVERHGLPKRTQNTIVDWNELNEELEQIRERGYSIENEERREGVVAIASPIKDKNDPEAVHAISISGPMKRIRTDGKVRQDLVEEVKQAANVVELEYNHY